MRYGIMTALALFATVGFEQRALAATLHVPAEFATIQAAIGAASDGDTIEISPGTYVENLFILSKGVTLVGIGGATVTTVRAATFGSVVETNNYATQSATRLQGLTITGGHTYFGGGLLAFGIAPVVVTDCVFDDNHSQYGYFGAAIAGWDPPFTIERCRFTNNEQQGDPQFFAGVITMFAGSTATIRNNVFWHNDTRAINLFTAHAPTVVENNTMIGNRAGLYVNSGPTNTGIAIRNNIIVNNLYGVECYVAHTYTLTLFENNLVFGNTTNFFNADVDPIGANGNISAPPGLVNEGAGDFHLAPGSPAIDAGTAVGAPADDIEHTMRPMDGNADGLSLFDIGAYEALGELFDRCIQDDSNGNILKINSTTGDYRFTNCSGFTLGGIGTLVFKGNITNLQHYAADRRVLARIDSSAKRGTASIQVFAYGRTFTITDRNTSNNTCTCAAP